MPSETAVCIFKHPDTRQQLEYVAHLREDCVGDYCIPCGGPDIRDPDSVHLKDGQHERMPILLLPLLHQHLFLVIQDSSGVPMGWVRHTNLAL